jgi:putative transposase
LRGKREKIYIIRKEKGRLNVYTKSENNGDEKVFVITSLDADEKSANQYANLFRRRWVIETSYRVEDDFKQKTTSTKPAIRLYYFLFSVCVYNIWVIVNMILSMVLEILSGKPIITAKMIIILLQMSIMDKPPP